MTGVSKGREVPTLKNSTATCWEGLKENLIPYNDLN